MKPFMGKLMKRMWKLPQHYFNKIGFLASGETVKLKLKNRILLLYAVCLEYEQRNGQKAEVDEASFSLPYMNFRVQHAFKALYRW